MDDEIIDDDGSCTSNIGFLNDLFGGVLLLVNVEKEGGIGLLHHECTPCCTLANTVIIMIATGIGTVKNSDFFPVMIK